MAIDTPTEEPPVTSVATLLAVALCGGVAGLLLARQLGRHSYRKPEESTLPTRSVWWVPVVTAVVSGGVWWATAPGHPALVPLAYVACSWVLVGLAAVDLDVHRLPDAVQLPAYPALAVGLGACSLAAGDLPAWGRAIACGAGMFVLFLVLVLVAPAGGMGFGDVKLAGLLGMLLGWLGWRHATVATLGTFVLGGFVAVALLLTRRAGRSDAFAYGPVMVASALATIVLLPLGGSAP